MGGHLSISRGEEGVPGPLSQLEAWPPAHTLLQKRCLLGPENQGAASPNSVALYLWRKRILFFWQAYIKWYGSNELPTKPLLAVMLVMGDICPKEGKSTSKHKTEQPKNHTNYSTKPQKHHLACASLGKNTKWNIMLIKNWIINYLFTIAQGPHPCVLWFICNAVQRGCLETPAPIPHGFMEIIPMWPNKDCHPTSL